MKTAKFYVHGDKDTARDIGNKIGLTGDALNVFAYTGYELVFDIEVEDDGKAYAVALQGVPLTKRVLI